MLGSPRTYWPQCSAHHEARPGPRPVAHAISFIDRATDREDPEQGSVSVKVQLSSRDHPGGLGSGRGAPLVGRHRAWVPRASALWKGISSQQAGP